MSNHPSTPPPPRPPSTHDESLIERLDELGRELVAAEVESGAAVTPASDSPFMQAVARRAQFRSLGRLAPRLGLAAAAAVALFAGYLIVSSRPVTPHLPGPSIASENENASAPTLANLRKLNQDVTSPDQLRLTGGSAASPGTSSNPVIPAARPASPLDARASDRIDAITGGK